MIVRLVPSSGLFNCWHKTTLNILTRKTKIIANQTNSFLTFADSKSRDIIINKNVASLRRCVKLLNR